MEPVEANLLATTSARNCISPEKADITKAGRKDLRRFVLHQGIKLFTSRPAVHMTGTTQGGARVGRGRKEAREQYVRAAISRL